MNTILIPICALLSVTCTPIPEHKPMQEHEIWEFLDNYVPVGSRGDPKRIQLDDLVGFEFDSEDIGRL